MSEFVFKGRCWKAGDFIPTDQIIKTRRVYQPLEEAAKFVLEDENPRFGKEVQKGDILIAGKHFGQSSGRAVAVKAMIATGVSCVVAEYFSRTFYRNAFEIGLPVMEVEGVSAAATEGDIVKVDIPNGLFVNETTGVQLKGNPVDPFLLDMIRGGGIIALGPKLAGGAA
jgi:3-isopropylmalate/(R)-2-methylmalate dehydratase small subunit